MMIVDRCSLLLQRASFFPVEDDDLDDDRRSLLVAASASFFFFLEAFLGCVATGFRKVRNQYVSTHGHLQPFLCTHVVGVTSYWIVTETYEGSDQTLNT